MTADATTIPMSSPPSATTARPVTDRAARGPDVVRPWRSSASCMMNFHGYLIIGRRAGDELGPVLPPVEGSADYPLRRHVRAHRRGRGDLAHPSGHRQRQTIRPPSAKRWTLIRRGLVLYGFGLIYYELWSGSILPYYGAMFVIAAFLFTLATPWLVAIGVGAAVAGAGIHWWVDRARRRRTSTRWLTNPPTSSPRGLLFNVFVNGTHPLFPWLAFLREPRPAVLRPTGRRPDRRRWSGGRLGDRFRADPVRSGDAGLRTPLGGSDRDPSLAVLASGTRSIVGCSTPPAPWEPRSPPSP